MEAPPGDRPFPKSSSLTLRWTRLAVAAFLPCWGRRRVDGPRSCHLQGRRDLRAGVTLSAGVDNLLRQLQDPHHLGTEPYVDPVLGPPRAQVLHQLADRATLVRDGVAGRGLLGVGTGVPAVLVVERQ